MRAVVVIGMFGIVFGGGAVSQAEPAPAPGPDQPAPGWQLLARSAAGRPIEFAQFGLAAGKRRAMVVGPLAGDQPGGLALVDALAAWAASAELTAGVSITIIRDPNPDGRARRTAANAAGVELDRNFATDDWQLDPTGRRPASGPRPHSEPESAALARALARVRPDLLLIVRGSDGPAALAALGPCAEAAGLPTAAPLDIVPLRPAPGSLAAFAAGQGVNVLVLQAPDLSARRSWELYGASIVGLLETVAGASTPQPQLAAVPDTGADQSPQPIPARSVSTGNPEAPTIGVPPTIAPAAPLTRVILPEAVDRQSPPTVEGRPAGRPHSIYFPATRIERRPPPGL